MTINPVISICIPTYKRIDYLVQSVESIISQNIFLESNDVELVISDNDPDTDDVYEAVHRYIVDFPTKIKYFHNENNVGDYNFYLALSRGTGRFLKLSNDTLIYKDNALSDIIGFLKKLHDNSVIFFKNERYKSICEYSSSVEFLEKVSYFSTWIGGFGIWRSQLKYYSNLTRDVFSDHLSQTQCLVSEIISGNFSKFIVYEQDFAYTKLSTSGNYNLFEVFLFNYIRILKQLEEKSIFSSKEIKKQAYFVYKRHVLPRMFNLDHQYDYILKDFWKYSKYLHGYLWFYTLLFKFSVKKILRSIPSWVNKY